MKIILLTITVLCGLICVFFLFMQLPIFGKLPSGKSLERIKNSPQYKNGQFQNQTHTPNLAEGYSYFTLIKRQFTEKVANGEPKTPIPIVETDLLNLDRNKNLIIWFGHSSYFVQIEGVRLLIDPVFSGNASPLPGTVTAFKNTNTYQVKDIPEVDYLIISHDHFDHLDYKTIKALKPKVKEVICGLGVAAHLERWGYNDEIITEMDWFEKTQLAPNLTLFTEPARHFSGRGFLRNKSLWLSFVLKSKDQQIYLGGDSGYDDHYAKIGEKYGYFDLALIENGQYNEAWKYIHNLPEQQLKLAKELKTKRLMPVHNSKFKLGLHDWNEPLIKLKENFAGSNIPLVTPKIGEIVDLDNPNQQFTAWWESVK